MNHDLTISDELLQKAISRVSLCGYDPEPQRLFPSRLDTVVGAPCSTCAHYDADHMIHLGPIRLCMGLGCDCGRRSLTALRRSLMPFLPLIAAGAYFGAHLVSWAIQGFRVQP